ncbi:MAG: cytochrome-c oxidase, cbb3-type subunit III [Caulobacteraceae bacterium]
MADRNEIDDHSGIETTGHEWDGIKELDNPLPRWWLWVFYASIAAAIVYWVLMPAWPGISGYTQGTLKQSDRASVVRELAALKAKRGAEGAMLRTASLEEIERDPKLQAYALAAGQAVFGDNCATCHGQGGVGAKGYANLRDDIWLWGGSLPQIEHTIRYGVRSGHPKAHLSVMPAFGRDQMLKPQQIDDLTEYVLALSNQKADRAAIHRAAPIFREQCASCHGFDGKGDQSKGAPNLTDKEWLYGRDAASIHGQIWNGRGGVMPAWSGRLDDDTIKAMAVYIHANAGGQ